MSYMTLRFANLDERWLYYRHEFDPSSVREVLGDWNQFAIIIGKRTRIYLQQYKHIYHRVIKLNCKIDDLRDKLLQYLPEAVYYIRRQNEILLDFDPEKVHTCKYLKKWDFCPYLFEELKKHVYKMYEILENAGYDPEIRFSGRGFHIVLFTDKVIETKNFLLDVIDNYKLAVDPIVMYKRLARLPYSLNSLTTRIVTPISIDDLETFSLDDDRIIPKFLRCKDDRRSGDG